MTEEASAKSIHEGDRPQTASQILPHVYSELRQVANGMMAKEAKGHSLQATALIHEAYLRLTKREGQPLWGDRNHFSAVLVEVMRRILVENARRRKRIKRGGQLTRVDFDPELVEQNQADESILVVDEALTGLAAVNSNWAQLVKLRCFLGMTVPEAAHALQVSPRTVDSWWSAARLWMRNKIAIDLDSAFPDLIKNDRA